MTDIVSKEKRSRMMSGIRGQNTRPELLVRKLLHSKGFRYTIHSAKLPGKPDLVFPKYKALLLVNGCFWHKHNCHLFKLPSTRPQFWKEKLDKNVERDFNNLKLLTERGWRIAVLWECALKGKEKLPHDLVINQLSDFIKSDKEFIEIRGIEGSAD